MTEQERMAWINNANYQELLKLWRFEPSGSPWFLNEVGEIFRNRMSKLKSKDPANAAQASKNIGWRID